MGSHESKLIDENLITGLSFIEDGHFSKIYKGHFGHNLVSIKVPKVSQELRKNKKRVKGHIKEVKKLMPRLSKMRNENIVTVFGVAFDELRKEVWVVREYVDGADIEILMNNSTLCPKLRIPEERIKVAIGIANGIAYLHSHRWPIVHGDFKPSDILIDVLSLKPKITNYGLWDFKNFFEAEREQELFVNPYQAPEVLLLGERPCLLTDLWSLGAVLLQWLVEQPAWNFTQLCKRYKTGKDEFRALKCAMEKEESPTIINYLNHSDLNESTLEFLRNCFSYSVISNTFIGFFTFLQVSLRPSARSILDELSQISQIPSWTNIAYHKYYEQ